MGEKILSNIINFNVSSATMQVYLKSREKEWKSGTVHKSESLFREAMSELADPEQQQIERAMSFLRDSEGIVFRIMIAIVQDIGAFEKQQSEKGELERQQATNTLQQKGLGAQLLLKYLNNEFVKNIDDQIRCDLANLPQEFVSAIKENFFATSTSFEDFKSDLDGHGKPSKKAKSEPLSDSFKRGREMARKGSDSGVGIGVVALGALALLALFFTRKE
jgi:hypothetical protein